MKHEQKNIRPAKRRETYRNRYEESEGIQRAARDNFITSRASEQPVERFEVLTKPN